MPTAACIQRQESDLARAAQPGEQLCSLEAQAVSSRLTHLYCLQCVGQIGHPGMQNMQWHHPEVNKVWPSEVPACNVPQLPTQDKHIRTGLACCLLHQSHSLPKTSHAVQYPSAAAAGEQSTSKGLAKKAQKSYLPERLENCHRLRDLMKEWLSWMYARAKSRKLRQRAAVSPCDSSKGDEDCGMVFTGASVICKIAYHCQPLGKQEVERPSFTDIWGPIRR